MYQGLSEQTWSRPGLRVPLETTRRLESSGMWLRVGGHTLGLCTHSGGSPYWTWRRGSPCPPLLPFASGRTWLHPCGLGWWMASTSRAAPSWSPTWPSLCGSLDQCHWVAAGVHPWEQGLRRWEIIESEGVKRAFEPRLLIYPRARKSRPGARHPSSCILVGKQEPWVGRKLARKIRSKGQVGWSGA